MSKKFYITTAIDYVNGRPHIGHALEKTQADVLARYHRALGEDVFFLTGTDEHGVKNKKSAEAAGMSPQNFVDESSKRFLELTRALNISNDYFIRTSDKKVHWPGAIKMWKALENSGDIYKKNYKGLYCVGHEAFVTKKDLVDGKCALHKTEPEVIDEENYFFRLSKYTKGIKKHIKSGRFKIIPKAAENEIMNLLNKGLEDVSFSRPSKDLDWGVPVPGDKEHTIYVWSDALVNYLSAIGYGQLSVVNKNKDKTGTALSLRSGSGAMEGLSPNNGQLFHKYWPADIQIIGKDILRFHAAIWPGMLISAGLPLPKVLFVHGFISVGGEKMSKSLGNVVDPFELVKKYGADAVRYYLMREVPPTNDGDFTYKKFDERYKADLAKGLGNFTARVAALGARHIKDEFGARKGKNIQKEIEKIWTRYRAAMEEFRFDEALQAVWGLISYGDKFVNDSRLWELPEKDPKKFEEYIAELAVILFEVSKMIKPFMPATSQAIAKQLGAKPRNIVPDKFRFKKGNPLFPMV